MLETGHAINPSATSRPIVNLRPIPQVENEQTTVRTTTGATVGEGVKSDPGVKAFGEVKSNSGVETRPTERADSREAIAEARPFYSGSIVKANLSFRREELLRKRPVADPQSKAEIRAPSGAVAQQPKSLVSSESHEDSKPKPRPAADFETVEELESFLSSSSNDEFEAFLRSSTDEELHTFLRLATEETAEPTLAPEQDEDLQAFLTSDTSQEFEAIVIPGRGQEPGAIIIIGPEHDSNPAERAHTKRTPEPLAKLTEPTVKLAEPSVKLAQPAVKVTEPQPTTTASWETHYSDEEDLPDMIISGATITFTRPFGNGRR